MLCGGRMTKSVLRVFIYKYVLVVDSTLFGWVCGGGGGDMIVLCFMIYETHCE